MKKQQFTYYEFFAGGGMARAGLGTRWRCLMANDNDVKKAASYAANWGGNELVVRDIESLTTIDLPEVAHMAWASFPCQDLSLAGNKLGLRGNRSGTFWPFWSLIKSLCAERRPPPVVILENVYGALTSHGGKDFAAIGDALTDIGYRVGIQVIDAALFVPQSRVRLFIVAVRNDLKVPPRLTTDSPQTSLWYPDRAIRAFQNLSPAAAQNWVWWNAPVPAERRIKLEDLIEESPDGVDWNSTRETARLLSMMSDVNKEKVRRAKMSKSRIVGTAYRRTRGGTQRLEVRFDGIAGCLRTPGGGSSRQTIIEVKGARVRSRLIAPREAAKLMGLPDSYVLPQRYNDAYHLLGDGLVVPVVSHLVHTLVEPLLELNATVVSRAA